MLFCFFVVVSQKWQGGSFLLYKVNGESWIVSTRWVWFSDYDACRSVSIGKKAGRGWSWGAWLLKPRPPSSTVVTAVLPCKDKNPLLFLWYTMSYWYFWDIQDFLYHVYKYLGEKPRNQGRTQYNNSYRSLTLFWDTQIELWCSAFI